MYSNDAKINQYKFKIFERYCKTVDIYNYTRILKKKTMIFFNNYYLDDMKIFCYIKRCKKSV